MVRRANDSKGPALQSDMCTVKDSQSDDGEGWAKHGFDHGFAVTSCPRGRAPVLISRKMVEGFDAATSMQHYLKEKGVSAGLVAGSGTS